MALVRYWASARDAAGTVEERVDGTTLAAVLAAACAAHGDRLAGVVGVCSFLVDGEPLGRRDPSGVSVGSDTVVEVLPPFAGG